MEVNLFETEKDNVLNDRHPDADSKKNDYEPIVTKHREPKNESNKQKNRLKTTPKAGTSSSDTECETILLKHTKSEDASSKPKNKLKTNPKSDSNTDHEAIKPKPK